MFVLTFIIRPVFVVGISMEPTLKNNDILIMDSVTPHFNGYKRGDIVFIYSDSHMNRLGREYDLLRVKVTKALKIPKTLIKRLIALEGDIFEIRENDGVYVNGIKLKEDYIKELNITSITPVKVPEGTCIILGDNRNMSLDSTLFGFVPTKYILGVARIRVFPFNRIEIFKGGD